jgi:hypothetical protein
MKILAPLLLTSAFLLNFFRVDKIFGMDALTWATFQVMLFGGVTWLYFKLIKHPPQ